MFQLSNAVLASLGKSRQEIFESRLAKYLRDSFPMRCEQADDQTMRKFASFAIAKSRTYDIVLERDVAKFATLMIALHPKFDTDPNMAWARSLLTDKRRTAEDRLEAVYQTLMGNEQRNMSPMTGRDHA
ncbi:hypothetical protein ABMY26_34700 [Azospirillum sp. HJ39]|uniref:hypothetical protein n=1 Tax=Azospirillum sp. HJ39 TaxID=3159496 RepID=UPI0035576C66